MANPPLAGLKIAVTRPRAQAVPLVLGIEKAGGIPLLFPLLDITSMQDDEKLREQVFTLPQFDLMIFISPNAVQYGMAAIHDAALTHDIFKADGGIKIATVGPGSARALLELGITNVIVPTGSSDSESLLELLKMQHVAGWRIMIFRGDGGRELLGDTLKARGAYVEYATCYQRGKPRQDISLLMEAAPDVLTVTSSEALHNLWQMLDATQRAALYDLPLFVTHHRIAELAQQQGWRLVLLSGAGDEGLLSALTAWAQRRETGTK